MKTLLKPLPKSVLMSSGLTAAASAADAGEFLGSGMTASISNEEMDDIMEIVKCIEESSLLKEGVSEPLQNETK